MTVGTFLPTPTVQGYVTFVKFAGTVDTLGTELAGATPDEITVQAVADADVTGQALLIVNDQDVIQVPPNAWVGFVNGGWQVHPDDAMNGAYNSLYAPFTPS